MTVQEAMEKEFTRPCHYCQGTGDWKNGQGRIDCEVCNGTSRLFAATRPELLDAINALRSHITILEGRNE